MNRRKICIEIRYQQSAEAREIAERMRTFVDEVVLPREREWLGQRGPASDADRAAEAEELVADLLPVFEQVGRSILALRAVHVAAPDEGNMYILEAAGSEAQTEESLQSSAEL